GVQPAEITALAQRRHVDDDLPDAHAAPMPDVPCFPARLRGAFEAPPSLVARPSLLSPGGAAPLRLARPCASMVPGRETAAEAGPGVPRRTMSWLAAFYREAKRPPHAVTRAGDAPARGRVASLHQVLGHEMQLRVGVRDRPRERGVRPVEARLRHAPVRQLFMGGREGVAGRANPR